VLVTARTRVALVGCVALAPLAAGCGEDEPVLTVLAAASLAGAFDDLAERFEQTHPGVDVRVAYDSSATLAQQAAEGAPADVLATADQRTMEAAEPALASAPRVFATNTMVLVTPADGDGTVDDVEDLEHAAYVVCVEQAPCGALARQLLDRNDVDAALASREPDVRGVLARVVADEADAGLVYATDARSAGRDVETHPVPHAEEAATPYPIATLADAAEPGLAAEFVDLVLSAPGQAVLAVAGFGATP
jgi:molybdate transport system substrate-binding protein